MFIEAFADFLRFFFSLKRKFCKYSKNWMNGKCLNARLMIKSTVLISGYFCFFVTCSLLDLSYICMFSSKRFTTKPYFLYFCSCLTRIELKILINIYMSILTCIVVWIKFMEYIKFQHVYVNISNCFLHAFSQ